MSEKLIIRNFGPIKDVELELKKFNVIIGENATGKSTIAKVLAICRYFSYISNQHLITKNPFELGLIEWGLGEYIKAGSYFYYENLHYKFEATCEKIELSHKVENQSTNPYDFLGFFVTLEPLSSDFSYLLDQLHDVQSKNLKSNSDFPNLYIPPSFFQNYVAHVLDNPFYLPTERGLQSIFSLGKSSISNISDSLYNQFAKMDMISKNFKTEEDIIPLAISYKNIDGVPLIKKHDEEQFYSLSNGASGYQSAIPIVLVFEYYIEKIKKTKTFIIEEPELNLFPITQQRLVTYLVEKTVQHHNTTLITTHSPYILTSLNNLMFAYEVGRNNNEVSNLIEEKSWINPDDVCAYLLRNGNIESLIDSELKQIKVEKIDEISEVLSKQWHELADLNYAAK